MYKNDDHVKAFLEEQGLPDSYGLTAQKWFTSVVNALRAHHNGAKPTIFIGINGSQGSGKSTLSAYLAHQLSHQYQLNVLVMSLDDFYLTKAERIQLGQSVHPLLRTRGVPGTHDVSLMYDVLQKLAAHEAVAIPRFDKASDDRMPQSEWEQVASKQDIVIVEGWCWGTSAQAEQDLTHPTNALERNEDPDSVWRGYVNSRLQKEYPRLYDFMDEWIFLQAPSFESIYQWRCEQEHKLIAKVGSAKSTMSDDEISIFIQHYQRLTEHSLCTLDKKCNWVFKLDNERNIIESIYNAE